MPGYAIREAARRYGVHPSVAHGRSILEGLRAKTGRSLEEWIELLDRDAPAGERERRDWLKQEQRLGGTVARLIAEQSVGKGAESVDPVAYLEAAVGYVDAMYGGGKAGLRPIHEALVDLGLSLGDDVRVCPCKTIVPLYRKRVFAEIKPATMRRLELGLALEGVDRPLPERLMDTGGLAKGDRITHRFALTASGEIDSEVTEWLRIAYELDA
jgi:hypothetical protein